MYVIVEAGGKQHRLAEGDTVRVELMDGEVGSEVVLDSVLAARTEEGLQIGNPSLEGASVKATIVRHGRDKKIKVFKFKRRKGYRKRIGHRQGFTELHIDKIALA